MVLERIFLDIDYFLFLLAFSKIFEKCMYSRLLSFLDNFFFHYNQFGFRLKHSKEHAFMVLLKFIHKTLDEGRTPAEIFVDVRKAFDSTSTCYPTFQNGTHRDTGKQLSLV